MDVRKRITIRKPNLVDYQKEFLYNDARFTFVEASTKAGKTFAMIWWIFERAMSDEWEGKPTNHWWIAPIYRQAEIAFDRLKRRLRNKGFKIMEGYKKIICPNGSIITFMSAENFDALYGDDVYSIVFDEAPRARVEAWYALRSTITATGGTIKMIGNFGGRANWMHQLKEKSKTDKEYQYFKITAYDAVEAGILDKEEIEQAKRDLPDNIFKALYLAEGNDNENQLIDNNTIGSLWSNDFAETGKKYITADIAFMGSDRFSVFVWNGWQIVDAFITSKIEPDKVVETIKGLAKKHGVQEHNIVYDRDGLGGFLSGYLKRAIGFNNGGAVLPENGNKKPNYGNLKDQCGYGIARIVNREGIWVATDKIPKTDFIEELECLQSYRLDTDTKLRLLPKDKIKIQIGRSPDLLDSFIMRYIFEIKNVKPKAKFGIGGGTL